MRYDSDPYIINKFLTEAETLHTSLTQSHLPSMKPEELFASLEAVAGTFLNTLDHFVKLHTLNPQFSLSRFNLHNIERQLLALRSGITDAFARKEFASLDTQVEWNKDRFLLTNPGIRDSEHLFITLYKKISQTLDTYMVERVQANPFVVLLNEAVGWSEHVEVHGHHDVHAIILFAQKIARDKAVIEHRVEVVREICLLLKDQAFLQEAGQPADAQQAREATLQLSQMYSPYLLRIYNSLLTDLEIAAISQRDYHAFEQYCHDHHIEIYEEYRDKIKDYLNSYFEDIALNIPAAFQMISTAAIMVNADTLCERYQDVEETTDVLGVNLNEDMRMLQQAIRRVKRDYPALSQRYFATVQKVRKLKRELVRPAIRVYSQYLREPDKFFQQLPQNQAEWLPILESALACLEPDDDLYLKCDDLKNQITHFTHETPDTL